MSIYKALIDFRDDTDNSVYRKGEIYPREGVPVDDERVTYLSSKANRLRRPVIEVAAQPEDMSEATPEDDLAALRALAVELKIPYASQMGREKLTAAIAAAEQN